MKQVTLSNSVMPFYFKSIDSLVVRLSPVIENYELPKYLFTLNWRDLHFLFDWTDIYLDVPNEAETTKSIDNDVATMKQMKEDWKTEEEIKERSTGRGIEYIDRKKCIITSDDDFMAKLKATIELL